MVIPAGDFLMGCEQGRDEERPVHRVWVDAFEMAIYQVRNRDFAVFMQATGHPAPPNWGQAGLRRSRPSGGLRQLVRSAEILPVAREA